jgi:hypothetical protein
VTNLFAALSNIRKQKQYYSKCRGEEHGILSNIRKQKQYYSKCRGKEHEIQKAIVTVEKVSCV